MYVIYALIDKEDRVYYVGQTNDIKQRIRQHRYSCNNENHNNYNCKVYDYIRENNLEINYTVLEENITEEDKYKKEREWYGKFENLCNVDTPNRSYKEWYQDNKEQIAEFKSKWYQENKERLAEKNRQPWTCEICNKQLHGHRSRHLKLHE